MTVRSGAELEGLERIGRIVARALGAMQASVRPGVTTAELDHTCAQTLLQYGASATPRSEYSFPGWSCISVNDEIVHGVPGARALEPGDVVKLDVTADLDGFVADAARTVIVSGGGVGADADGARRRLVDCAKRAFERACALASAGRNIRDLGRQVEEEARSNGFGIFRELCGHGVGRKTHEPPDIPNFFDWRIEGKLKDGAVITIEPILSAGKGDVVKGDDGWTLRTADGSIAAHHEETIVVTRGGPIIVTAA